MKESITVGEKENLKAAIEKKRKRIIEVMKQADREALEGGESYWWIWVLVDIETAEPGMWHCYSDDIVPIEVMEGTHYLIKAYNGRPWQEEEIRMIGAEEYIEPAIGRTEEEIEEYLQEAEKEGWYEAELEEAIHRIDQWQINLF